MTRYQPIVLQTPRPHWVTDEGTMYHVQFSLQEIATWGTFTPDRPLEAELLDRAWLLILSSLPGAVTIEPTPDSWTITADEGLTADDEAPLSERATPTTYLCVSFKVQPEKPA